MILVLYVDDLLTAGSDQSEFIVINLLRNDLEMSKAKVATEFLAIYLDYIPDHLV